MGPAHGVTDIKRQYRVGPCGQPPMGFAGRQLARDPRPIFKMGMKIIRV